MAENEQLTAPGERRRRRRAPVCAEQIARLLRRTERGWEGLQQGPMEGGHRVARISQAVWQRLSLVRPSRLDSDSARCEPYLLVAAMGWLKETCRTPDSWTSYLKALSDWIGSTDRRSLSAQAEATPGDVVAWLDEQEARELSARTIHHHHSVLSSWFRWLEDRDIVHRSPVRSRQVSRRFRLDEAQVQRGTGMRQALKLDEAQRLARWCLREASPFVGLAVLLQAIGGLRSHEVAAADRRHLHEHDGTVALVVHGKGKRVRRIALEPIVVAAWERCRRVQRLRGDRGALIVRRGGGRVSARTVQRWAKRALRVIGRADDMASHDLRRTAATLLGEHGASLRQVQLYLGHASPSTTARCYVVRDGEMAARTGVEVPA